MVAHSQKRSWESQKAPTTKSYKIVKCVQCAVLQMMEYLQSREWGLLILDGQSCTGTIIEIAIHVTLISVEVQTIPANKFRRVLTG